MEPIKFDYNKRYNTIDDLILLKGNSVMYFTKKGAIEACKHAMDYDILIWRIEGGIWQNPGFQPWIDAMWDAQCNPPTTREEAIKSNIRAVVNIVEEEPQYDVFILTVTNYQGLPKEHLYDKYFEKHPQ